MAAELVEDVDYDSEWDASSASDVGTEEVSVASIAATVINAGIEVNRGVNEVQVSPPTTDCDAIGGVGDTQPALNRQQQQLQEQSDAAAICSDAVVNTVQGETITNKNTVVARAENTSLCHTDAYTDDLADKLLGGSENIGEDRVPSTLGNPAVARGTSIARIETNGGSTGQHTARRTLLEQRGGGWMSAGAVANLATPPDDHKVMAGAAQLAEQRGKILLDDSRSTPDEERASQGSATARPTISDTLIRVRAVIDAVAHDRREDSTKLLARSPVDNSEGSGARENRSRDDMVGMGGESHADNRSNNSTLPSNKGINLSWGRVHSDSDSSRPHNSAPLEITSPATSPRSPRPTRQSTVQRGDGCIAKGDCAEKPTDKCRVKMTNQDVTSLSLAQSVENALLLQGAADESRIQEEVCSATSLWSLTIQRCRLPSLLPVAGLLNNLSKLCSLEINGCSNLGLTGLEQVLEDAPCLRALTLRRCGISQLPLLASESIEVSQVYDERINNGKMVHNNSAASTTNTMSDLSILKTIAAVSLIIFR